MTLTNKYAGFTKSGKRLNLLMHLFLLGRHMVQTDSVMHYIQYTELHHNHVSNEDYMMSTDECNST